MLADGCRVVAVLGMGGIGKTSLVLRLTQQVASRFDSGIVSLAAQCATLGPLADGLSIHTASMQQATLA